MDTDHSEPTRSDGQAPSPVWPSSAGTMIDQTQPSPRAGGTGPGQAPAPAGLSYTPPPQQPQVPYGSPYQPGFTPPEGYAKPRRNWTPCYAAACLVLLLVLAGAIAFAIWAGQHLGKGIFGNVISLATRLNELNRDVSATPLEAIKSSATPATADEIQQRPADFEGRWLVLECKVTSEPTKSEGNFAMGGVSQNIEAMMYPVDAPMVILDISGSPAVAHTGDTIHAFGKIMAWDCSEIGELPFVGKAVEEGMKNDPTLKGQTSVYFFIAKQVELAPVNPAGVTGGKEQTEGKGDGANQAGSKSEDSSSDTVGAGGENN
jgi:hypothetical protein